MSNLAEHYREKAARLAEMAVTARTAQGASEFRTIADLWLRMASEADAVARETGARRAFLRPLTLPDLNV